MPAGYFDPRPIGAQEVPDPTFDESLQQYQRRVAASVKHPPSPGDLRRHWGLCLDAMYRRWAKPGAAYVNTDGDTVVT